MCNQKKPELTDQCYNIYNDMIEDGNKKIPATTIEVAGKLSDNSIVLILHEFDLFSLFSANEEKHIHARCQMADWN